MGLAKLTEQNDSEEVDDNKNIKRSAIKNRKISITTTNVIPVSRKQLIAWIKVTLSEDKQNMRVKKVWIEITS